MLHSSLCIGCWLLIFSLATQSVLRQLLWKPASVRPACNRGTRAERKSVCRIRPPAWYWGCNGMLPALTRTVCGPKGRGMDGKGDCPLVPPDPISKGASARWHRHCETGVRVALGGSGSWFVSARWPQKQLSGEVIPGSTDKRLENEPGMGSAGFCTCYRPTPCTWIPSRASGPGAPHHSKLSLLRAEELGCFNVHGG